MLRPVPRQGIEILLGDVRPIRAFQEGGDYWELDAQKLIRSTRLGRFLPRVEREGPAQADANQPRGGAALFQLVHGRKEVASTSASRPKADIPLEEVEALAEAVGDLHRLAADPACDPSKKRMLESFKLPDPAAMPECYRTYGPFWNRRLLVLWGYEHKEGDSTDPQSVAKKLAPRVDRASRMKRWLATALALAAMLALLAAAWWLIRHALPGPAVVADGNRPATLPSRDADLLRNWDANRAVPHPGNNELVMVPSGDANFAPVTVPLTTGRPIGVLTFGPDSNAVLVRLIRPDGNVVNTPYPWDWLRLFRGVPILFDPLTRTFVPMGPLTIVDPAFSTRAAAAQPLKNVAWSVEIKSEIEGGQYVLTAQLSPDIADLRVTRWIVGGVPQASTANSIRVPVGQETSIEVWAESSADPGRTLKQTIQIGKK